MTECPVCGAATEDLAAHFVAAAEASDAAHVMWLNRNVTKHRLTAPELAPLLAAWARSEPIPGVARVRR